MAFGTATRRIQSLRSGRTEAIVRWRPILSSATGTDWQGLILERHLADQVYDARDTEAPSNILHFFEGVPLTCEWWYDAHTHRVDLPGSMALEPQGFRFDVHCVRTQRAPQWILNLNQAIFARDDRAKTRGSPGPDVEHT
jgi:hypothetical protein